MASVLPHHRALTSRLEAVLLELALPVALVALWWGLSSGSTALYYPPLSHILSTLQREWLFSGLRTDAVPSLEDLFIGYLVACAVGVSVGVVLGLSTGLASALTPLLEGLRAVPGVALLPAALLLIGPNARMRISIIAFGAVWPILLNTIDGVTGIDPVVADVARSYRISPVQRLVRIVLPAAGPRIVAGMRTAVSIAITLIVFSEMFGSTDGIGFRLLATQRNFDIPGLWAATILLGILGYLINLLFRVFEHAVLGWHHQMTATTRS